MKQIITRKETKIIIVLLVLILILFGTYLIYIFSVEEKKNTIDKKTVKVEQPCSVLTSDGGELSGSVPFSPTLRSKITSDYNLNEAVCQWTINNVSTPNTYPVGGECVFGGRTLASPGDYKITLKVAGLSDCLRTTTIIGK